jgi:hypothetical protein
VAELSALTAPLRSVVVVVVVVPATIVDAPPLPPPFVNNDNGSAIAEEPFFLVELELLIPRPLVILVDSGADRVTRVVIVVANGV